MYFFCKDNIGVYVYFMFPIFLMNEWMNKLENKKFQFLKFTEIYEVTEISVNLYFTEILLKLKLTT